MSQKRRRPTNQPTKQLPHPNDPTITVTVQKPTRTQLSELAPLFSKSQRAVQVYDKDLKPALDQNGEPQVVFQFVPTNEPTLASLRISVVGWSGMLDENGSAIPFSKDRIEMLTEEWLDTTTDEEVEVVDSETKQKRTEKRPITRQFAQYINREINRKEFWTSDPFGSASSISSTEPAA